MRSMNTSARRAPTHAWSSRRHRQEPGAGEGRLGCGDALGQPPPHPRPCQGAAGTERRQGAEALPRTEGRRLFHGPDRARQAGVRHRAGIQSAYSKVFNLGGAGAQPRKPVGRPAGSEILVYPIVATKSNELPSLCHCNGFRIRQPGVPAPLPELSRFLCLHSRG